MPRARLGLKAPAWAWLGWARAQDFASPSPSPQTGLGRAGLGLGPGLLSYFVLCALRISFKSNNTIAVILTIQTGFRFGLGCWSKLEIFSFTSEVCRPGLEGPAWLEIFEAQALGPPKPAAGLGLAWPERAGLGGLEGFRPGPGHHYVGFILKTRSGGKSHFPSFPLWKSTPLPGFAFWLLPLPAPRPFPLLDPVSLAHSFPSYLTFTYLVNTLGLPSGSRISAKPLLPEFPSNEKIRVAFQPPPPEFTQKILGGISCWVEIENSSAATEYRIEAFDDQRVITCWIASEVGKPFSVAWKNCFLPAPTAGHVFMDGTECGGRVLTGPSSAIAKHSGVTDTRTVKEFVFSSLTVTGDDDDAFLGDLPSHRKLGCIEVAIYPVQIFGFVATVSNSSTLSEIKIHERSKKSVTEQIRLAEPKMLLAPQNALAHRFTGPPIVTFVFKYRPLDVLRANGIAPPLPPLPQRKRKHSVELFHLLSDEDLSEAEQIRILRDKLHALEKKHAQKGKRSLVKEEEGENIPPTAGQSRKKGRVNGD
ncbi:hypothetical protein B0H12DRAFT_1068046 [Mycena haematopus]|nr:hypothetical protein B0H12DRAFT_1068046 [Mycena haematopus]